MEQASLPEFIYRFVNPKQSKIMSKAFKNNYEIGLKTTRFESIRVGFLI